MYFDGYWLIWEISRNCRLEYRKIGCVVVQKIHVYDVLHYESFYNIVLNLKMLHFHTNGCIRFWRVMCINQLVNFRARKCKLYLK